MKASGGARPHASAGPSWPAQALKAGLVDECHLFVSPGASSEAASRPCPTTFASHLELLDERRFGNGVVYLRYRMGARS